ncbi:MAG: SIMPL domain-containing protein [Dermatophilaceae bacterium]|nr:SIMPL domain-containing protein [Actinomycetales bacterium]MBP8879687.1 SIMPL domain-containing protein [Dermatophilaceae bacterium]MBP9918465.1 SIMPL domain-containing protein [Dermatophilaceae bacterium]
MNHADHHRTRPSCVDVSGTGAATAPADVVRVSIGLRCEADSVAAALSDVAARVTKVSAAVRSGGVADKDITSLSASVQPRWDREGTRVVGYTAYHQLSVVVRTLDDLNAVVDAVAAAAGDALVIDGIALEIADRAPLAKRAREAAFAAAREKAEQFAQLSGVTLGRVLQVTEQEAGFGGGRQADAKYALASGPSGGMPVEAGEHEVTAVVRVTWALE